ncbi:MAG: Ribosomal RNA small subunit methyltransferase I [Parcubacteria group bacterium GW2011_GWA2_49_9]|nr:MAG: Ribosomal RNA small subunit methyltransferase I [Parcubacteria group bacterium GW2011_GWA2_49_9]
MGILYVVGTPIGNLEDVTLRALRVLKEADVILCEDTRVTQKLLAKYEITGKQLAPYNEQDSGVTAGKIIGWLEEGKSVALVSDAGTPGISDPGTLLVQKVREALPEVKIESVPGPSALTTALSIAGIPAHEFVFLGFLPHKKGRETLFKEIATSERTMTFYESPHRILKALESLQKFAPNKKVIIARELTKIHEEIKSGTPAELLEFFKANEEKVRGEFVVLVNPLL